MNNNQATQRLSKLSNLITSYAYMWPNSDRLTGWVYEYDRIIASHPDAFQAHCIAKGLDKYHTGHDCLA